MDFIQQRLDMVREEVYWKYSELKEDLAFWKKIAVISLVANAGWLGFFAWLVTR